MWKLKSLRIFWQKRVHMWIWASDKSEDILNQNIILIWHQWISWTLLLLDIPRKSRYNPVFSLLKKKYVMQACTTLRNVFIEKNIKTCLHFLPFFTYTILFKEMCCTFFFFRESFMSNLPCYFWRVFSCNRYTEVTLICCEDDTRFFKYQRAGIIV